jgi:two-component system cell cycle sensor histidine kinase/response regulator CckA
LHDRFRKIRDQSLRAGKLTSKLLTFAGGRALQPSKINLNVLIEEEMGLLTRLIGENIKVRILAAPDLSVTLADPTQMEQVLMNLCVNARDAMEQGGELVIETQNVELSPEFCRDHCVDPPGSYVLLRVSDTGIGIDSATMQHIFEPFFTTKAIGKGNGLGLATVYGAVKQHGGLVFAESEPGKGSSFRVYLPVCTGKHEHRETRDDDDRPTGSETILLAEDHDGLRETAREMLEALGYRVLVASDGGKALELFTANAKQIDLVVIDVVMPVLSGPEAYLEMCALKPNVRVIFTTGYTPEAKALTSMLERGGVILQKPYSHASLSQMVRGAIEQPVSA